MSGEVKSGILDLLGRTEGFIVHHFQLVCKILLLYKTMNCCYPLQDYPSKTCSVTDISQMDCYKGTNRKLKDSHMHTRHVC